MGAKSSIKIGTTVQVLTMTGLTISIFCKLLRSTENLKCKTQVSVELVTSSLPYQSFSTPIVPTEPTRVTITTSLWAQKPEKPSAILSLALTSGSASTSSRKVFIHGTGTLPPAEHENHSQ